MTDLTIPQFPVVMVPKPSYDNIEQKLVDHLNGKLIAHATKSMILVEADERSLNKLYTHLRNRDISPEHVRDCT